MASQLTRRAFIGTAASAFAGFSLFGCSQNSAPSSKGDSDEPKKLTKITFCLDYTPNTNHTGIYVAQQKGYFKDAGIDIEIVQPAEDGAEAMIGSGQAQLGISYQDFIANTLASDNPVPIEAIAAIIQHNTSGIMSRKEDGITSPKFMQNHTYATWNMPIEQATVKHVVEKDGGDFSKIKMVPADATTDEVQGLKAKLYDCVWVFEGWGVQNAHVQNYDINYFAFNDMDEVFDFYTPVLAVNSNFVQESEDNRSLVQNFVEACSQGYTDAVKDPDGAAQILCDAVKELDPALVRESQHFLSKKYIDDAKRWGIIDPVRWSRYFQWLNDNKLVNHPIDVNKGFSMEYITYY